LLLFQFPFACDQASEFPQSSHHPDSQQKTKRDKVGAAIIVFKSTDGKTITDVKSKEGQK